MRAFKSTLSNSTKVRTNSVNNRDDSQTNEKSFLGGAPRITDDMSPYIQAKKGERSY